MRYFSEEAKRLRRPAPLPFALKIALKAGRLFASKERQSAFLRSMGYALLQPSGSNLRTGIGDRVAVRVSTTTTIRMSGISPSCLRLLLH